MKLKYLKLYPISITVATITFHAQWFFGVSGVLTLLIAGYPAQQCRPIAATMANAEAAARLELHEFMKLQGLI